MAVSSSVPILTPAQLYPDSNGIFNASLGSQRYGGSAPSSFGFAGGSYYARTTVSF